MTLTSKIYQNPDTVVNADYNIDDDVNPFRSAKLTFSIQELISRIGGADTSLTDIAKELASQGRLLSEALSDLAAKVRYVLED